MGAAGYDVSQNRRYFGWVAKVKEKLRSGKWGRRCSGREAARAVMMRWERAWCDWGMAGSQSEEDGARKLAWGQMVSQIKESGFHRVSRGRMTT